MIKEAGLEIFTLKQFLREYQELSPSFDFEPLAANPETTARRDLAALVEDGYLKVDDSGRASVWRRTDKPIEEALSQQPAPSAQENGNNFGGIDLGVIDLSVKPGSIPAELPGIGPAFFARAAFDLLSLRPVSSVTGLVTP